MKEIITVYIGQAGVQLSSAVWELFGAEHGVCTDGKINCDDYNKGIDRLFYVTSESQCLPRCLIIDLDASVIDEIRTGCYKNFFGPDNLISGFEDSASIFSRGYFTLGRLYINRIMEKFYKQLENSDSIQGFAFMHSMGGGTGSGLNALLLEELDSFSKISKLELAVHPSFPSSPIIVQPYNTVLAEHYTIDETDISFMVDNEALFRIANTNLQSLKPSYATINRIVAQTFSSIISSSRFGEYSSTISEVLHNLVPYPRIHFPICSIAPMNDSDGLTHSVNSTYSITKEALSNRAQLINCYPDEGKYMACCFMYRGDIKTGEIHDAIMRLRCHESLRFVDWCPTGIKVTLCSRCPTFVLKSGIGQSNKMITIISNNSAITDPMLHNTFRFQVLFQKRSFVHWFVGEGMEEDEFKDSLENIACLIKDYDECSLSTRLLVDGSNVESKLIRNASTDIPSKDEEKEEQSAMNDTVTAANDNHIVEEDFVSSFQASESFDTHSNKRKDIQQSNDNFCCYDINPKDNFSSSIIIPVINKSS